MTYRDAITIEMQKLSRQPKTVFLGEGISTGDRIYGTMNKVPLKKCIEMPVAENLIMGTAIGLAMGGYKPVVVFQRMDFMLIAADQIINHACLIPKMSNDQYRLPIVIRAIIGSQDTKFDVGPQHKHDFTHIFEPYIDTIAYSAGLDIYKLVYSQDTPTLMIERKDTYELEWTQDTEAL